MLSNKVYTLSELANVLRESTQNKNEFKPKLGDKVESEDKKNNKEAVRAIMKQTGDYNSDKVNSKRKTNPEDPKDWNKTTLDVEFDTEPSKEYKERVEAQAGGYASVDNKKNSDAKDNGGLDFDGNEKFYKEQSKKVKERSKMKTDEKHAGLKSHNLPKDIFKKDTLFKESKAMKRLHFKNTTFLSEAQMLKKVPDEYKTDGNKFIMRDSTGTDYLVECKVDDTLNYAQLKVVNTINREQVNEELKRMRSLYDYQSADYSNGTTAKSRLNEDNELRKLMSVIKNANTK